MLRKIVLAVLYTALACGANAGALDGLLNGDLKKLAVLETPVTTPEAELLDASDAPHAMTEYKGKCCLLYTSRCV